MSAVGARAAALLDPFLALLYPPRCLLCHTLGTPCLCDSCVAQILPVPEPGCSRCGHSLVAEICSHCHHRAPAFVRARALGAYDGLLRDAIHRFKYHDRPQLAAPLGLLLADYARAHSSALNDLRFDSVVPVPMHPIRRRLRGYNQSERLARVAAGTLGLPLDARALHRSRHTRPQVGLAANARQTNLRGAFAVPHPENVSGKTLLLIDDVSTTSSTLHECAATLNASGANAVYALTLAAG